jgi:hypothetical protein
VENICVGRSGLELVEDQEQLGLLSSLTSPLILIDGEN